MGANLKSQEAIKEDFIAKVAASTDEMTDFTDTTPVVAIANGLSVVLEDLYNRVFRVFRSVLPVAVFESFDFKRKNALESVVNIVYGSNSPAPSDVPISDGAIISTTDGVQFRTTASSTLLTGNTVTPLIPAVAVIAGVVGNVKAGTITQLVTQIPGIDNVTNSQDASGGQDQESVEALKERFILFIRGLARTTPDGLKSGAKEIDGVVSVSTDEGACTVDVYIDDGTGVPSEALRQEVQDHLIANNKPAGTDIIVKIPSKILVVIAAGVELEPFADPDTEKGLVETAIINYINTLEIGDNVIFARLVEAALSASPNVRNVVFTVPDCEDITVSANQVARTDAASVTVS